MHREYHKWWSPRLGRDMELKIIGHGGVPVMVFPTSGGRFYEFEDRKMPECVQGRVDGGHVQFFCVDSVDMESWYNREVGSRWRIARHVQYEDYLIHEVVPLMKQKNWSPQLISLGCSFGGYHAVNIALKHPDVFSGFLSMSGAYDLVGNMLRGYHDDDVYLNMPTQYLANLSDPWFFDQYRHNKRYVLATGTHDQCWADNESLARVMRRKDIPVQLDVWGDNTGHDWPYWQRMMQAYL